MDITRQEQIRRKYAEAESARREAEREVAAASAALRKAEEADQAGAERAQATRMETMRKNRATIDERARVEAERDGEKFLARRRIEDGRREFEDLVKAHGKKCSVGDLI